MKSALEGVVMLIILRVMTHSVLGLKRPGLVAGVWLVWYAIARSICEFFREPEPLHALQHCAVHGWASLLLAHVVARRLSDRHGPPRCCRGDQVRVTYDPQARRDTPLALKLKAGIARNGPMTVAEYMGHCLWDEEYGYYATRPVIGSAGDFITAAEISQVFGEIIGLWSAVVWQQVLGSPPAVHLVEYGAGRGTMMRDALRAARVVPASSRR